MSETGAKARAQRPKSRHRHVGEHENHERWLLTYSDMITLLMALFMVLFSISSVNTSKFKYLQKSLREAFSPAHVLSGGSSILQSGSAATPTRSLVPATEGSAVHSITPTAPSTVAQMLAFKAALSAAQLEQESLLALARRINNYARAHGFANQVNAVVARRGLVITVLTDKLLFASGEASLQPAGLPLLDEIARLLNLDTERHPIVVEGYTDNVPIDTVEFPSNWELSTDRATTVVRYLIGRGVPEDRLSAAGYADQFPVASNATAAGRAKNRRVEIVLERINPDLAQTQP
ncbi:flagellar motor protein MotB [Conexibacter sp. DBS9H8]|uniref:flagellar motor protein MotB n=1 Tax=Conexibacter sp. DBS9H8 TaxID=2937801 RepID=UPI002111E631|nr:flagellar motor protein MotB [Conexibacter sp. DBS9H8]